MDSFEFNKIAGAVLGSLLLVMGLAFFAETLFYKEKQETPGILVAVDETGEGGEAVEVVEIPLPVLLAGVTVEQGERQVRACAACHSFEQGGANGVGPNLWHVVGGPKAHIDGFGYSEALSARAAAGEVWGFEELDAFLENPQGYLAGTSMSFGGIRNEENRAAVIVYLNSLSDSPLPLPEVTEAPAEEAPVEDDSAATESN